MFIIKSFVAISITLMFFMNMAAAQTDEVISGNLSQDIHVAFDNIFISKINGSISVFETVVFRNEGLEIQNTDNHTYFEISIPSDAVNLKTDAMECCMVQEGGVVYMDPMKSVKSGENFEMSISYELAPLEKEYVFHKNTAYKTSALSIYIEKNAGLNVDDVHESMKLSGKEYKAFIFHDMEPGESVRIPVKISARSGYFYPAAGLILLLLALLVYHFRGSLIKKEYTLEELELEKHKIFRAIRGFEKHAGGESSEEYRRLIDEYRQRGINVIMKIDKIKAKPD